MDRPLIHQGFSEHGNTGAASAGGSAAAPPTTSLPPTRAARPARSRGVFFARYRLARLAHWAACALSVAVTAFSIAVTAPHVIDAPAVLLNPGPALVATTSMLPAIFAPRS